jgi:hypothetical protein
MQRCFPSNAMMMPPFPYNTPNGAPFGMFPGGPFAFMPPHSSAFGMLPPTLTHNGNHVMPMVPMSAFVSNAGANNAEMYNIAAQMAAAAAQSQSLFPAFGGYGSLPAGFPGVNGGIPLQTAGTVATTSANSFQSLLMATASGQTQMPCSVRNEDGSPCGKTFTNPEELLRHIRDHVQPSLSSKEVTPRKLSPVASSTLSDNVSPASTLSSSSSSNGSGTTPTSQVLRPSSAASSGSSARFHPYGKPNAVPSTSAAPTMSPFDAQQMMIMQQFAAMAAGMMPPQSQTTLPFTYPLVPMGITASPQQQPQRLVSTGVPQS